MATCIRTWQRGGRLVGVSVQLRLLVSKEVRFMTTVTSWFVVGQSAQLGVSGNLMKQLV